MMLPETWRRFRRAAVLLLAGVCLAGPAWGEEVKKALPVEIQVIPEAGSVQREKPLKIHIVIANRSPGRIQFIELHPATPGFEVTPVARLGNLEPFDSIWPLLKVIPKEAGFGKHRLLFVIRYTWQEGGARYRSAQTATAEVEVQRELDDAAKALPGGSAAVFYLILPVLPALFGFHLTERWRVGKGPWLPSFSGEKIMMAAVLALTGNAVFSLLAPRMGGRNSLDYAETSTLGLVLLVSFVAGALPPLARRAWAAVQMNEWGFQEGDGLEEYLRKALLGPSAAVGLRWVQIQNGPATWKGVLLVQPDGKRCLGPRLQVSPTREGPAPLRRARDLVHRIQQGDAKARKSLIREIEQRRLQVSLAEHVACNSETIDRPRTVSEKMIGSEEPREMADRRWLLVCTS